MTGYGVATSETSDFSIKIELRSLNSKTFDLKLKLPVNLSDKEIDLQNYLEKKIVRGKVDASISFKYLKADLQKPQLNTDLSNAYLQEMRHYCRHNDLAEDHLALILFSMPNIYNGAQESSTFEEQEYIAIMETLDCAVNQFINFRNSEGIKLQAEIINYLDKIEELSKEIASAKDFRTQRIHDKMTEKIEEFINSDFDKSRYEQELFYYLEKLDITEELDRLNSHIQYFRETVNELEAGRKLSFITQEIGREINTLGAKSNDHNMQKSVVMMKNELEKIKQQLANIL